MSRLVLGDPVNAASELRAVLPEELTARLDLDRLTRVDTSFVDDELSQRYTDLLFKAPLDGREAFVCVLIEHQSSTDQLMPFRMLRYLVRVWDRHLERNPHTRRLPVVIPLVLHHDKSPWSGPVEIRDLIDLDPDWADAVDQYVPRFRFMLHDLCLVDEQALRAQPLTLTVRLTFWLLKTARGNTRLTKELRGWWADQMRQVLDRPGGAEVFRAFVIYIGCVAETPADDLYDLFEELGPDAKEAYVTTADMLRAEGRTKGRTEGLAEGRTKGRTEMVVKQLTVKFGPLPDTALARVRAATAEQLETWAVRVLTADTLDEVLH